ncbi:unnamed protein product [Blepharisma stoltei]|uniref:Importin subunit alpha n=1 Tax=Blepharisma stoltei TaxID=1481888 RepID=A0AAU9JZ98_9CILI|nr:unnamed protein product [Blepharisma stoltei]
MAEYDPLVSDTARSLTEDTLASHEKNEMESMLTILTCGDAQDVFIIIQQIRKMLSTEKNPPIQEILDLGVLPTLADLFAVNQFKRDIAWIISNIASGNQMQCHQAVQVNSIDIFCQCLNSGKEDLVVQGMMGLGNIAGNDAHCRDQILIPEVIEKISEIRENASEEFRHVHCWLISNLLNFKPIPGEPLTEKLLPVIKKYYDSNDEEMIGNAAWALFRLLQNEEDAEMIVRSGVIPKTITLIMSPDQKISNASSKLIKKILKITGKFNEYLIGEGILNIIPRSIKNKNQHIRKDTVDILSKLCENNTNAAYSVISLGILNRIIEMALKDIKEIRNGCIKTLCNIALSENDIIPIMMTEDFFPALLCVFRGNFQNLYELTIKTFKATFDYLEEATGHESAIIVYKNFEEQGGVTHLERILTSADGSLLKEIEILNHMLNRYK